MLTFFFLLKEERVERIPECLIMLRWTKNAKIGFLNVDYCGEVDSNLMDIARYGALCSVSTNFYMEVSKKGGLYADVLDDIQKLQEMYVSSEVPIVTGNLTVDHVRDPLLVKCKGAPKRTKKAPKVVKKCSNCGSMQHNARKSLQAMSISLCPYLSLLAKKIWKKDQRKGNQRERHVLQAMKHVCRLLNGLDTS